MAAPALNALPRRRAAARAGGGQPRPWAALPLPAVAAACATDSNVDSAEYANIVLSFSRFYGAARAAAGMRAPGHARLRLLREWVRRAARPATGHTAAISTGTPATASRAGTRRKKLVLAQQALIGLAAAARAAAERPLGRVGASGCSTAASPAYDGLVARERRSRRRWPSASTSFAETRGDAYLAAARAAMNAVLARSRPGSGAQPALAPAGPVRLRPGHRAARGHDPRLQHGHHRRQPGRVPLRRDRPRAPLRRRPGGRGERSAGGRRGAFGLVARRGDGRIAARHAVRARRRLNRRVTPLRLIRAPRGVGVRAGTTARRAYAGPFTDLRTAGTVRAHGLRATSRYRFTPDRIDARWTLARSAPGRRVVAEVGFPSWGAGATAVAELRDGRTLTREARARAAPLRAVRAHRERSGLVHDRPRGGSAARPDRAAAHASPAVRATRRSDAHRRARLTHRERR